jgi:hypothetical protein
MVLACLFCQKNKLMPPFAQSQEKGEEGAADEEPGRKSHFDRQASSHNPDEKAGGNDKDIEDDDMLQPERIGDLE